MNKIIILALIPFIINHAHLEANLHQKFQKFISKYNKKYSSAEEYFTRYQNFVKNYLELKSMEDRPYKTGITQFFDMSPQEISNNYLNFDHKKLPLNLTPFKVKVSNDVPESYDWRNFITMPMKDQGSCGSGWAFATLEMLETLYSKEKGMYLTFSEQMLIDCVSKNSGCNGGYIEYALEWIMNNGIMKASDYPYTGMKGTCKSSSARYIDMKVTGYQKLGEASPIYGPADEEEMKVLLYQKGPYSVGINCDQLYMYSSGILDVSSTKCPPTGINHHVLLVGYGTTNGIDYWILKNSWGSSWGERGYFRVARGKSVCGVNYYAIVADVEF